MKCALRLLHGEAAAKRAQFDEHAFSQLALT